MFTSRDYVIKSNDEYNYSKIDVNIPSPSTQYCSFTVTSLTTLFSTNILNTNDHITILKIRKEYIESYTTINKWYMNNKGKEYYIKADINLPKNFLLIYYPFLNKIPNINDDSVLIYIFKNPLFINDEENEEEEEADVVEDDKVYSEGKDIYVTPIKNTSERIFYKKYLIVVCDIFTICSDATYINSEIFSSRTLFLLNRFVNIYDNTTLSYIENNEVKIKYKYSNIFSTSDDNERKTLINALSPEEMNEYIKESRMKQAYVNRRECLSGIYFTITNNNLVKIVSASPFVIVSASKYMQYILGIYNSNIAEHIDLLSITDIDKITIIINNLIGSSLIKYNTIFSNIQSSYRNEIIEYQRNINDVLNTAFIYSRNSIKYISPNDYEYLTSDEYKLNINTETEYYNSIISNEYYYYISSSTSYTSLTPILYLKSNIGNSCYTNMNENTYNNISNKRIVMKINNTFIGGSTLIYTNGEFTSIVQSNDLSHIHLELVDEYDILLNILSPLYITIHIDEIPDIVSQSPRYITKLLNQRLRREYPSQSYRMILQKTTGDVVEYNDDNEEINGENTDETEENISAATSYVVEVQQAIDEHNDTMEFVDSSSVIDINVD